MSRVGNKIINVPKGVQVTVKGEHLTVKGPKGQLEQDVPEGITSKLENDQLTFERASDAPAMRSKHGLTRALAQNMVTGVSEGFERRLEINGVGYRAEAKGDTLTLNLGFSHPIDYKLPKGVSAKVEKNIIVLSGIDRDRLGLTAAKVRSFRPPEPYKGKGVKYIEETIRRKVGKAGAA